jgi:predicted ATPase/DNA-binding winged helix-turn-helix (wHTH) protein
MFEVLHFGRYEFRPSERVLLADGAPVALGARAFDLLQALIERRGRIVGKDELLDLVGPGLVVEEANVQVQVSHLRKLLDPRIVATIPGRGYRFVMPVHEQGAGDPAAPGAEAASETSVRSDTNLPLCIEPLIGRQADIAVLSRLVADERLVTVLGPGGIGKTRLAQAVARALVDRHPDGVWWLDLAALSTGAQIAPAIAATVRLQLGAGDAALILARALAQRGALLLVLDNCEHLAGEVAVLVQAILAVAPGIRLLATSQEMLQVAGEHVYRLEPLAVPPPGTPLRAARHYSALQLLEHRARAADRTFELGADTIDAAIGLCRQLDGIALTLEMAAARLPTLGIETVRRLVAEGLLRNARRNVPPRQQMLCATLDWSHALLDRTEQAVLRRLSVFAGAFALELAQQIAADADVDGWAVLDAMSTLVDKSLLQVVRERPPSYRLLETTRHYAGQRLRDAGEADDLHRRHGQVLAALADTAVEAFDESSDADWLSAYARHQDDWIQAFRTACARGDADVAGATGRALCRLDSARSLDAMDRSRMAAAHALLPLAGPRAKALLWDVVAWPFFLQLPQVTRVEALQQAAAAWRALGDRPRECRALWTLARELAHAGEWAPANAAAAAARALEDPSWPVRERLWAAESAMIVWALRGDLTGYRERAQAVLAFAQRAGAMSAVVWARLNLADYALRAGDVGEAIASYEAALAEVQALKWPNMVGHCLSRLCAGWLIAGELVPARAAAVRALPLMPLMRECGWLACLLNHVALLAARLRRPATAARLLGFAEATYAARRTVPLPIEAHVVILATAAVDAALGSSEHALLRAQGANLSASEAEALAREALAVEAVERDPEHAVDNVSPSSPMRGAAPRVRTRPATGMH